jgi:type IV fimbrial biogenesis protein FimT
MPQSRVLTVPTLMPICSIPDMKRRSGGVTLIELLVVIAIVAILSAIAVPSFVSTTQKYRITSEMNSFYVDLQYARSEAARRGVQVAICASTNGSSCSGNAASWNMGWIIGTDPADGAMTIFRKQAAWPGSDTMSSSVSAVLFTRDGFTAALPTSMVTFVATTMPANTNAIQCVSVNSVGRQQKLSYTASGPCK